RSVGRVGDELAGIALGIRRRDASPPRDVLVSIQSGDKCRHVVERERPEPDRIVLELHGALCASYVPNSSRSALQISPTVECAASASRIGGRRFSVPPAAPSTRATAPSAAP